ncbi:hypothetical protein D3C85_1176580 [compost metagenome]
MQAIGAEADHQLLGLHRQALILQPALVAQAVILLPQQRILHQPLELGCRQPQHQILHRRQGLEQVRIEGAGAGGQLLGQRIPGILTALRGCQHGDVPADVADALGAQAYLAQEILQGIGLLAHRP